MRQEVVALGIALFWIYMCLGVVVVGYAIRMKIRDIKERKMNRK